METINDPAAATKTCGNGPNCQHPDGPTLPLTEFYGQWGRLARQCKECTKAYQKTRPRYGRKSERITWRDAEREVAEYLQVKGIYAVSGIASEWTWVDVVAWGCVRIEVKTANFNGRSFQFHIASTKRKNWSKNDLLVLVCKSKHETTYHVFPKSFAIFRNADGTPKDSISYFPDPAFRHHTRPTLTREIMDDHRDRWELVEDIRRVWMAERALTG